MEQASIAIQPRHTVLYHPDQRVNPKQWVSRLGYIVLDGARKIYEKLSPPCGTFPVPRHINLNDKALKVFSRVEALEAYTLCVCISHMIIV